MRVLVTGGAGFLGSNVVDALVARGDLVVALDDLSTGDRTNLAPDIPFRNANVADASALAWAVQGEGFDAIVHCASKTKVVESMEKPDLYRRVIVEGTRNVVALAETMHARMLVNVSTGGAMYGETPVCATENVPAEPDSNYGRFKLEAERIVAQSDIPSITLRCANIYGPRQRQDLEGGVIAIFLGCWRRLTELLGPPAAVVRAPARTVETQRSCLDPHKAAHDRFWTPKTALRAGLARTIELA